MLLFLVFLRDEKNLSFRVVELIKIIGVLASLKSISPEL